MAQAGVSETAELENHRATFHGFLVSTTWVSIHIAQALALLTLAIAIGMGWWTGLLVYVLIGVVAGLLFKMSGTYWAAQVAQWVLLGLGGMIVPAIAGMMH